MVKAKLKGEALTDDKTMIMERVIQLVANLPSDSKLRTELTNSFLGELWDSLEHPPSLYVGEKFRYRQADGSYNVRTHLPDTLIHVRLLTAPPRISCFPSSARPAPRMLAL